MQSICFKYLQLSVARPLFYIFFIGLHALGPFVGRILKEVSKYIIFEIGSLEVFHSSELRCVEAKGFEAKKIKK